MKKYLLMLIFALALSTNGQIIYSQKISVAQRKPNNQSGAQQKYACLPSEIKLDTVVSVIRKTSGLRGKVEYEIVKQRLVKLNAKCQNGKLVDGKGKEIRFYQLKGCWGNPPSDYREILENQQNELKELKRKFTLIEITCNASGEMPL